MSDNPFKPSRALGGGSPATASSGGGGGAWGGGGGGASKGLGAFKPTASGGTDGASSSGGGGLDSEILRKREQQLEVRESELKMREKELKDLEAKLKASGQLVAPKNWPPCCPILRHDIAKDIPPQMQNSVKLVYVSFVFGVLCFFWTFLCTTAALFGASEDAHDDHKILQAWLLSAIYAVAGIPGAFVLWYMRLYVAAQKDRAMTYFMFFLFYFVHIMWCGWAFLAPPVGVQWSLPGLMTMAEAFNDKAVLGIFYLIGCILWAIEGLFCMYCLSNAYRVFRGRGEAIGAKAIAESVANQV